MKKILIAVLLIVFVFIAGRIWAQVTTATDCSTAGVTEFGNIVVNGTAPFFNALLSQSNADLTAKEQTDAAIQAGEADDEVKIATANAGLAAIANCVANQQSNQVNGS